MAKIQVKDTEVSVVRFRDEDYISLTDMVRKIENGLALVEKWLRNKNTIEFLGTWEEVYNPDFNSPEFEGIRNEAGTNRFLLSVKQWCYRTNSTGIVARTGRYGGTYAHRDIAFEFASFASRSGLVVSVSLRSGSFKTDLVTNGASSLSCSLSV